MIEGFAHSGLSAKYVLKKKKKKKKKIFHFIPKKKKKNVSISLSDLELVPSMPLSDVRCRCRIWLTLRSGSMFCEYML